MSRSNNPYLRRMRDQRVERTITQRWEYAVKIECPWCGGLAGRVRQPVDGEREDLLQSGTWEGECVTERGCGSLIWPTEAEVQRAAERTANKPYRPGKPYGGRTATLRARRRMPIENGNGVQIVLMRGTRLGT